MKKTISKGLFSQLLSSSGSKQLEDETSVTQIGSKRCCIQGLPPAKRFCSASVSSSRHIVMALHTVSLPASVRSITISLHNFIHWLTIGYTNKPRTYLLTPSRKRIGKSLACGSRCALVRECFKDEIVCKYIVLKVANIVHKEVVQLCSDTVQSSLLNPSIDLLTSFSWDALYSELNQHCPILTQILQHGCQTHQPSNNQLSIICLCIPDL